MNCMKVQSLMSAYLDCELPGVEMLGVRHHLNECSECAAEYEGLLEMKRSFGRMQAKLPSPDLAVRICERLDLVSPPLHERMLARLYKHVTTYPVRIRVAALGMSVFAMLLLIRTGEVTTTTDPFAQFAPMISIADRSPAPQLPDIWTIESSTVDSVMQAMPAAAQPWEALDEFGVNVQRHTASSTMPGLITVGY